MATCTKAVGKRKGTRPSREKRNALVLKHLPLVKHVLGRLTLRLPKHVDREELLEAGTIGLLDAAERFDRSRDVQFSTYAVSRIRGAMLDALRSKDWLPRTTRNDITALEEARSALEHENSRPPTQEELSERTGVSESRLAGLAHASEKSFFQSLDSATDDTIGGHYEMAFSRQDPHAHPAENAMLEEEKVHLANAIRRLPESERLVISLYYFETLRLHDIAKALNVSDSRVCQIHRAALNRLGRLMKEPGPLFAPAGIA